MESAAEMADQGHPHVHTELRVGFIRAEVGERFINGSRRKIQPVEKLPELFTPDSALPSTS